MYTKRQEERTREKPREPGGARAQERARYNNREHERTREKDTDGEIIIYRRHTQRRNIGKRGR